MSKPFKLSLYRRLRWALRLRVWPWRVPDGAKWIALDQRLGKRDAEHARAVAKRLGFPEDAS